MYNKIHAENTQLKTKILMLQMENTDYIGIQSKLVSILTCDDCDVRFENKQDFIEHIVLNHRVECNVCGEFCLTKEKLRMHIMKCHNGSIFMCNHCKKGFKVKSQMELHEKKEHLRNKERVELLKYQQELVLKIEQQKSQLYKSMISLKEKENKEKSK